jgi:hypothetical protein
MAPTEAIGVVVVALISIISLFALISKPFSNLTEAINDLKLVLTGLSKSLENTDRIVQKLDSRMTRAERAITDINLNCAKNGHYDDPPNET